jgi:hypothetical protein
MFGISKWRLAPCLLVIATWLACGGLPAFCRRPGYFSLLAHACAGARAWASKRKVTRRSHETSFAAPHGTSFASPAGRRNARCVPQGLPSVVSGMFAVARQPKATQALAKTKRADRGAKLSRTGCAPTKGEEMFRAATIHGDALERPSQTPPISPRQHHARRANPNFPQTTPPSIPLLPSFPPEVTACVKPVVETGIRCGAKAPSPELPPQR